MWVFGRTPSQGMPMLYIASDELSTGQGAGSRSRATGNKTFLLKRRTGRALHPADSRGLPAKWENRVIRSTPFVDCYPHSDPHGFLFLFHSTYMQPFSFYVLFTKAQTWIPPLAMKKKISLLPLCVLL